MGEWQHNRIGAKANSPMAAGKPEAYVWASDKSQHIIYRGGDNQVHEIYFKRDLFNKEWRYGGMLSTGAASQMMDGDPTGFAWEHDGTQHILFRGKDSNIHEIFYKKDLTHKGWEYGGALNAKVGGPLAAGNPTAFAWEEDNTQHIIYRGVDNNVHEVFYKKDLTHKGWEYGGALNAKCGAPAAVGDPYGFVWEHDHTMHIVYRGEDSQIHEIFYKKDLTHKGWEYGGTLNAKCGAPATSSDPTAYAWEGDKTQHIIYAGEDGQVHEIFYKKDLTHKGWEYGGSITANCGAPAAKGKVSAYVWERDHTQHIVYRGADQQIHELFYKKDFTHKGWAYGGALTAKLGAPLAISEPVGFAWEGDDTQHVVYVGLDNFIHELWQR